MSENPNSESSTIPRAEIILSDFGLAWDDLRNKRVLDMGSGPSALARAATSLGIKTKIFSIDEEHHQEWTGLPSDGASKIVRGDGENLPYGDESFDLVLDHAGVGVLGIPEAARVLRLGGEFRMYPIGGQVLEYWNIGYYLTEVRGQDPERVQEILPRFDVQIKESDGGIPNEYIRLREEALNTLSAEQKTDVIERLIDRYAQLTEMPIFSYQLKDPIAHEPNGFIKYKKLY